MKKYPKKHMQWCKVPINCHKKKKNQYILLSCFSQKLKQANKTEHICPRWVSGLNSKALHIRIPLWSFLKEKSAHFPLLLNAGLHDSSGKWFCSEDWRVASSLKASTVWGHRERQHSKITFPFAFLLFSLIYVLWCMPLLGIEV